MLTRFYTLLGSALWLVLLLAAPAAGAKIEFQRDIRPILSDRCFKCHGPDVEKRKAKLRLDVREDALKSAKSGEHAIVPGKVDQSELIVRIFASDEKDVMPPPEMKKPLSIEQKALIKQWIAEGAEYQPHWAYVKPKSPPLPIVQQTSWARSPIDTFILAKLEATGMKPSPPAAAATLARRAALDLTGLPPPPEALAAFVKNPTDKGYETLVDELFASPHYGERWARRWLDLARYADTNGYEKDRERSIWPYRDWVIRALNADMPFDQFTIEQLAGDLLPHASPSQIVATGFHRNTMLNEEGGIDPLEFRFNAMVDRVGTTATTWLGLTMQCCQCHTHKYDPIPHTEFYGLMAFLNNADEPDFDLPDPAAEQKYKASLKQAEAKLAQLPNQFPGGRDAMDKDFAKWLAKERQTSVHWTALKPLTAKSNMPLLTIQPDNSVLGSGDITKSDTYELTLHSDVKGIAALRLEALPDDSLPGHGPGMAFYEGPKGDFFLGEFKVSANGRPVKIVSATESYSKNNFGKTPVNAVLATDGDPQTGWSCAGRYGERSEAVFVFDKPLDAGEIQLKMMFGRHFACSLGHFRLSATAEPGAVAKDREPGITSLLLLPEEQLNAAQRQQLLNHFLLTHPSLAKQVAGIKALRERPAATTSLVMRERPASNPRPTFRHHRGEYTQPKERIDPVTLSILHPFPANQPKDRLTFARWLMSPDNPITPRVVMNRQWATIFGTGIVKTVQDFGYQGEMPSHPELLDWLATEFIRQKWSMKSMHKLIIMSSTYRQSSAIADLEPDNSNAATGASDNPQPSGARQTAKGSPKGEAGRPNQSAIRNPQLLDPNNRLLSHFPRTRLDAEIIRDSLLSTSGLMTDKTGGPSVFPPQPDGVTEVAYGSFKWQPSTGPERYRRSLYTFMKRTAPFAMFTTFDGPTGESCLAAREVSNSPMQALTAMNDIIVTEAAQALGGVLAASAGNDDQRVERLFVRTLSRPPEADERRLMLQFVNAQRQRLKSKELDAAKICGSAGSSPDRAAWTLAARTVFNLDEFVTKG